MKTTKPNPHDRLPLDAAFMAAGTLLLLIAVIVLAWPKIVALVGTSIVIGIVGALLGVPALWAADRFLSWSSPRRTPAQRYAHPFIVGAIVLVALALMALAMLTVG